MSFLLNYDDSAAKWNDVNTHSKIFSRITSFTFLPITFRYWLEKKYFCMKCEMHSRDDLRCWVHNATSQSQLRIKLLNKFHFFIEFWWWHFLRFPTLEKFTKFFQKHPKEWCHENGICFQASMGVACWDDNSRTMDGKCYKILQSGVESMLDDNLLIFKSNCTSPFKPKNKIKFNDSKAVKIECRWITNTRCANIRQLTRHCVNNRGELFKWFSLLSAETEQKIFLPCPHFDILKHQKSINHLLNSLPSMQ